MTDRLSHGHELTWCQRGERKFGAVRDPGGEHESAVSLLRDAEASEIIDSCSDAILRLGEGSSECGKMGPVVAVQHLGHIFHHDDVGLELNDDGRKRFQEMIALISALVLLAMRTEALTRSAPYEDQRFVW
ncbi:MAG: hypothetical protein M5U28_43215 [Sandaracinaceae bacterium]|nr:hypothetical protein [Sandaracinaceae bacterium]